MNTEFIYSSLAADPDLSELVETFVQEMPERISVLEAQARDKAWDQLARTAHQFKGSAGSYGFHAITPCAARLEMAAKNAEQEDEVLSAVRELLDSCRRLRAGVAQS